jgi:hypothetical protein
VEAKREKHVGKFEGSYMFYFVVKPDEMVLTVETGIDLDCAVEGYGGTGIGGCSDFDQV